MLRKRPVSGWRAATFLAALLAISLNFLQPVAHAALMRGAGLPSMAGVRTALCAPSGSEDPGQPALPKSSPVHECCLGLAHAPPLAAPPTVFFVLAPALERPRRPPALVAAAAVGNRDGPGKPRGPPLPA